MGAKHTGARANDYSPALFFSGKIRKKRRRRDRRAVRRDEEDEKKIKCGEREIKGKRGSILPREAARVKIRRRQVV